MPTSKFVASLADLARIAEASPTPQQRAQVVALRATLSSPRPMPARSLPVPGHGVPSFEPEAILAALEQHRVRYVLIGGIAALARGATLLNEDVDITPAPDLENLERLAAALRDLDARIRVDEPHRSLALLPFDSHLLAANEIWNLMTSHGRLDVVLRPSGFECGFEELRRGATREHIGDRLTVEVASLDNLIRSKEAAGRAKDRAAVSAPPASRAPA